METSSPFLEGQDEQDVEEFLSVLVQFKPSETSQK